MQQLHRDDVVGDRYAIVEELGRGGFGTVYKARHLGLDKDVAIKTLNLELAAVTNSQRPELFARFKREAQSLTMLRHGSIVGVMDFGLVNEATPFIVMDYFPGKPLLKWGETESPTLKQWLEVFRQIFEALQHAHASGVVHRDINSGNVLVSGPATAPKVMVIDWGIAYSIGASRITGMGLVVGTTGYVDPENYIEPSSDYVPESDFYAVGVLMFHALCRREPFATSVGMTEAQRYDVIRSNSTLSATDVVPDLPLQVEDFLCHLLHSERKYRPPCARACVEVIDLLTRDEYPDFDAVYTSHRGMVGLVPKPAPQAHKPEINLEAEKLKLAEMRAEFEQARSLQSSVKKANPEKPVAEVKDPLEKKTVSLLPRPVEAQVDASMLPPVPAKVPRPAAADALDKGASRYGYGTNAPSPWWKKQKRALGVGAVLVACIVAYVGRSGQKRPDVAEKQPAALVFKPEDLAPKKDESALAKFAPPVTASPQAVNSLSSFPPDIKAEYAGTIGGGVPPSPAGSLLAPSPRQGRRAERDKTDDIDRSLKPVGAADAAAREAAKSDSLAVPHNTTAEVRLLEELDTSNEEPLRAELRNSLIVSGVLSLPAGSVFSGRASLRHNRAQARFDKVTLPNGTEYRMSAIAVTSDGRDGIDGGRLEFGEPPPDKTGEKVLRAVGAVAAEAIGTLPGGDVLTRSSQTVATNEMRDATAAQQDAPRSKNRIIIPRRQMITVKFQAR